MKTKQLWNLIWQPQIRNASGVKQDLVSHKIWIRRLSPGEPGCLAGCLAACLAGTMQCVFRGLMILLNNNLKQTNERDVGIESLLAFCHVSVSLSCSNSSNIL